MQQPYDLPLEQLYTYKPERTALEDFKDFWKDALAELGSEKAEPQLEPHDYPADGVKVYWLTYRSIGGARIKGWYAVPDSKGPHPAIIKYHGYNASYDGNVHDIVNWALHGYAAFGMLVRGQNMSEDTSVSPHGHVPGWMTKGILDPKTYYYRGVYLDAVRAVEVVSGFAEVDEKRIGVIGASQGGGLAIAVSALSDIPKAAVSEYPYLSNFQRAIDTAIDQPYLEINSFFRRNSSPEVEQTAMNTLTYFDIMNLAESVKAPVLMSIGLVDTITPPSTVFAAYNHLNTDKDLKVYRYFGHEYIPAFHMEKLAFLKEHLK
ncbi:MULTISPECIES: acetylxylan esterase [Bacillus]|uniref:acetylxylan esterase n=1 Tax=Bacillus TaxID=1386 RepID=UPI00047A9D59|nr:MULTISPECIES: acetylxylan esterase [Bacillus]QHZ48678.1 acetylxylan esterase [Bacillus sp. NSP9.1]WFA05677.1 acetylxylan esterase [Bacillus sp. HSf4]